MVAKTYIEEIEDPVTGRLQVFEAATEGELDRLVEATFPPDHTGHPAPSDNPTDPGPALVSGND